MSVTPEEIAYQKAHASDFNADGLSAFCISGIVIVCVAVMLRLLSRRLQKNSLLADDYTLIAATILSCTAVVLFDVRVYHYGLGRHFYSLSLHDQVKFEQYDFAFNLAYTTGYPLSRISLVLLYQRIFVQRWFRNVCWFFIAAFAAYMISTVIIDSAITIPVQAYWYHNITPTHKVDLVKLYIANAAFNITTDSVLLFLPLTIIWRLSMTWMQKVGLTAIFAMGGLTLVASIARLVFFFQVDDNDISFSLIPIVWWTSAELFLGVLCPCLVTFRPLLHAAWHYVVTTIHRHSHYSTGNTGVERRFPTSFFSKGSRLTGTTAGTNATTTDKKSLTTASIVEDVDFVGRNISDPTPVTLPHAAAAAIPLTPANAATAPARDTRIPMGTITDDMALASLDPRMTPYGGASGAPSNPVASEAAAATRNHTNYSQRLPLGTTAAAVATPPTPPPQHHLSNTTSARSQHAPRSSGYVAATPNDHVASNRTNAMGSDATDLEQGQGMVAFGRHGKGVPKGQIGVQRDYILE